MTSVFQDWPHQWFCCFTTSGKNRIPTFEHLVDRTWQPPDLSELVQYLRTAPVVLCTSVDPRNCSYCGGRLDDVSTWRWDNKWLWPQTVAHYVEHHSVRLPDEMVDDIRRKQYIPPTDAECDGAKAEIVFASFYNFLDEHE